MALLKPGDQPPASGGTDVSALSKAAEQTSQGVEQASQGVALDAVNTNLEASLIDVSSTMGHQKLTIASNVAVAASQACTSCLVKPGPAAVGPIYMNAAGVTADSDDWPLDAAGTPVPIDNLNKLKFWSNTNGDFIHILWRN